MLWSSDSSIKGYFPQFLPVLFKSLYKRLVQQGLNQKKPPQAKHAKFQPIKQMFAFFKKQENFVTLEKGFQQRLGK